MSSETVLLPLSKIFNPKKFPIGKEFESLTSDLGCANTGEGYIFDCAWFDAILSGVLFGVVLIISQLVSERMKIYKKLDNNERYDWVSSVANWILSIVSTIGSLYILSINEWYLDHPGNPKNNVYAYNTQLNFFVPWMIGYNIGRIMHVISGLIRALNDINKWDVLPHILHIILYGVILDQKRFGMIAVFQMLLQSHHFYTVPQIIMEYTKHSNNLCYKMIDWIGFFIKFFILIFAGPYCLAILWYHWNIMKTFSWFTQMTYVIVIGLNTLLFTGDIAFGFYWIYCKIVGKDAKKWYKDFRKREKREKRKYKRAGYKYINQTNDLQNDMSDSDDLSDDDIDLGQTVPSNIKQTELTQRLNKSIS
eukprot:61516_1